MEIRPILVLIGLLAAAAAGAEAAYTWTDEDGIVHYSDRPEPGATEINLVGDKPASQSAPARPPAATTGASDNEGSEPAGPFKYDSHEIVSPGAEQTLWNIEGTLNVTLALTPALQPGHQVRVYFDGTPQIVNTTSFQLDEVWRGVHNLQAEVIDETGKLMIRSQPNRFYVQQNTINR
jgi:hypothetical protein